MRMTQGRQLGLGLVVVALAGALVGYFEAPFAVWLAIVLLAVVGAAAIQRQRPS